METALETSAKLERMIEGQVPLDKAFCPIEGHIDLGSPRLQLAKMEKRYYSPCLRRNPQSVYGLLCMAVMLQTVYGVEQEARVRRLYDRAFVINQTETLVQQCHLSFSNYFAQPKKRVSFDRVVRSRRSSRGWARVVAFQRGTKLVFTVEECEEGIVPTSRDMVISQAEAQFALKTRRYVKFNSEKHLAALGKRLVYVQKSASTFKVVHPALQRRRQESA